VADGVGHQLMPNDGQRLGQGLGQGTARGAHIETNGRVGAGAPPEGHGVFQIAGEIDRTLFQHAAVHQGQGGGDVAEPGQVTPAFGIIDNAQTNPDQRLQQLIAANDTALQLLDSCFCRRHCAPGCS